jgi:hypothetical protein
MSWPFPFRFGARDKTKDQEHRAILEYLSRWFDVDSTTALYAETRADAASIRTIWTTNRRIANQAQPKRMMEWLPEWESITKLRPSVDDTDVERRARMASKLKGQGGNSITNMAAAAEEELGVYYDGFALVDPDDWVTYWPGLNPGPPGYEFSSNRATMGFKMTRDDLDDASFVRRRSNLLLTIDQMRPSWMTYVVGVGSGFLAGVGIVGQTVI